MANIMKGKKAYSCSRNVMSPVSLKTKTSVALFKKEFGIDTRRSKLIPDKEREYTTKWLGKARYRAYSQTIKPRNEIHNLLPQEQHRQ
jgi:TPP-dependent indolepyruvate ferredoxin oxidoreductase alpha subunit